MEPVANEPPVSRSRALLIVAGLVAAVVVVTLVANWYVSTPFSESTRSHTFATQPTFSLESGTLRYAQGNFTMELADGWKPVDTTFVRVPPDIEGLKFAVMKEGTACVLAYFSMPDTWGEHYKQSSFAPRIFADDKQLDMSWWVHVDPEPAPEFDWDNRQPLPGEIRLAFYGVGPQERADKIASMFGLFANNGGMVPADCDQDMSDMMASLKESFEIRKLSPSDTGALYFHYDPNQKHRDYGRIFFRPDSDGIFYEVMRTDAGKYASYTQLIEGKLYYAQNGVHIFDPFTGADTVIEGTVPPSGHSLYDYYLWNDRIWYLTGEICEYLSCENLDLYEVPRAGGTQTLLVSGYGNENQGGSIVGFDEKDNVLYLRSTFGDAGFYSYTVNTFSYNTKSLQKIFSVTGEWGEADEPVETETVVDATVKADYEAFVKGRVEPRTAEYLRVENGKLMHPDDSTASKLPYSGATPITVY